MCRTGVPPQSILRTYIQPLHSIEFQDLTICVLHTHTHTECACMYLEVCLLFDVHISISSASILSSHFHNCSTCSRGTYSAYDPHPELKVLLTYLPPPTLRHSCPAEMPLNSKDAEREIRASPADPPPNFWWLFLELLRRESKLLLLSPPLSLVPCYLLHPHCVLVQQ